MEQDIEKMIVDNACDVYHIIRELDYECKYVTELKMSVVNALINTS